MVPPSLAASRASATAGNASSSRGSNVQVAAVVQSRPGAASGTRSGHARPSAIGIRMSGGLAWMIVAPSENSTIECTIDCGCTTTSTLSRPKPNSRCASITSRPLFTSVAELVVTSGPIFHVGCASACSGVTHASRSLGQPRNGPPLAVSTSRLTSEFAPARRHWAIVECSESTGTICPGLARLVTSGPPMISDSLLASARVRPASSAASVARRPAAPVTPFSTTSHCRPARWHTASGPGEHGDLGGGRRSPRLVRDDSSLIASVTDGAAASSATATTGTPNSTAWRASSAGLPPPAASATIRKRSGLRRAMSSAWVPIDPVEPRITTSRGAGVAVTRPLFHGCDDASGIRAGLAGMPEGNPARELPPLNLRRVTRWDRGPCRDNIPVTYGNYVQ